MMKKVLALVMVLGMAGLASAGLQFTANDATQADGALVISNAPGTISFAVVNTAAATGVFDGGAVINEGTGVLMDVAAVAANLPGTWSILDVTADLGMPAFFASWDVPAITPFAAGKLVTFDVSGKLGDKGKLTITNVNLEPVFSMNYLFTPEPMTLSLLGLGALVLRRRS
jgi:hypothetical protein